MKWLSNENSRKILVRFFIIIVMSFLTFAFIEWRFFGNDIERTFEFITESTPIFIYNAMLLIFINFVISSFFKTPWTGSGIVFIIAIIFSYISVQKQNFRGQPLLPEDFMLADQAGTITKFIDMGSLIRMILACVIVLGLTILLNFLTKSYFKTEKKSLRPFRATILLLGIFGFLGCSNFIINHRGGNGEKIPVINSQFIAWNQLLNYETNGFIVGFLYNWSKANLEPPAEYSETKIAEIKTELSQEDSSEKTSLEDADYNIIIVLNESFIDPEILSDFYQISGGDVTPNLHKMTKNNSAKNFATGKMYTIDYGGGTANVEFEVDTAMSTYFLSTVPFVDLLPRTDKVPSIAQIAKDAGYETLAIHPFNAGMYKRNIALKKEGFDRFIAEDEMEFTEKDGNREYINDRSAYKETLKYLKNLENRAMISLITMQNHAGYGMDNFDSLKYSVGGDFRSEEEMQLAVYLETLHSSDQYLGEFLTELENFDEKTVVLFYGDHFPGIVDRLSTSDDKEINDLSRITPYFIWANFELTGKKGGETLPTTSPNCLTNTLFDLLNLEKPDYLKLTNAVCQETPILAQAYFASEEPAKTPAFRNYELYIYDILGGKQYWYK